MADLLMAKKKPVHPIRFSQPMWDAIEKSRRAHARKHPEDQRPSVAKTIRRLVRLSLEREGLLQPGEVSDEIE
jgi:hypothetical protein